MLKSLKFDWKLNCRELGPEYYSEKQTKDEMSDRLTAQLVHQSSEGTKLFICEVTNIHTVLQAIVLALVWSLNCNSYDTTFQTDPSSNPTINLPSSYLWSQLYTYPTKSRSNSSTLVKSLGHSWSWVLQKETQTRYKGHRISSQVDGRWHIVQCTVGNNGSVGGKFWNP